MSDETLPSIFLGGGGEGYSAAQSLLLGKANRHGLVAGATGTGKTVTLQIMAQQFSDAGVPVFCADVKGDLSGISQPGNAENKLHPKLVSRAETIGMGELAYKAAPAFSGTSTPRPGIPSGPPLPRWGRSFWRGCWTSTKRRKAC